MQLSDIDTNLKYLILTVLLLLPLAPAYNLTVPEADTEFAMCTVSTGCRGVEMGNTCIGVEKRDETCINPMNAPEYRRVEAECGLDAQGICNADPSLQAFEWTEHPNASYNGKTCSQWAEEDDRIDLLKCEQTFNDITQWK